MAELRVALVHDWLTGMRGAERVLIELCRLFPNAQIHTLLWNRGSVDAAIESRIHQTSFLQRLPKVSTSYRLYLPFFPSAANSLKIRDADLVLSSSHAVAKGVLAPPGVPHVSYVHTPMRYLWDETGNYFKFGPGRSWKRVALKLAAPYLRRFDVNTASRVTDFIANSETTRNRIRRVYQRDAVVIPPPVDTDYFQPSTAVARGNFFLIASALEPYKRIDLAIEAFRGIGRPLWIAGTGTLANELRRIAPSNVRFLGRVSDRELRELYRSCRALIFPGIEDFGIVPVEAQACGTPVICYGAGGATETVVDTRTGLYFQPQDSGALAGAIEQFDRMSWDRQVIRANSLPFSIRNFQDRMRAFLRSRLSIEPPPESDETDRRAVWA